MKKTVFYPLIMGIIVPFLIESCASIDTNENCTIKKMSNIHVYNDSTYSISVLFTNRTTKEQRKTIISQKITEDYPQFTLYEEHPGKRYNEYWYILKKN